MWVFNMKMQNNNYKYKKKNKINYKNLFNPKNIF